jgi:hypothetical protein
LNFILPFQGFNDITDLSLSALPSHLKKLKISGNPIKAFTAHSLSHFYSLSELVMEDMPVLGDIGRKTFPRSITSRSVSTLWSTKQI